MDTRQYTQFRDRINSSVTDEQLAALRSDIHNMPRDPDKEDLYNLITRREALIARMHGTGVKGSITSRQRTIV